LLFFFGTDISYKTLKDLCKKINVYPRSAAIFYVSGEFARMFRVFREEVCRILYRHRARKKMPDIITVQID
jgi:hypothetical protein